MNIVIADDHQLILAGFVDFLEKKAPLYSYFQANNKQELDSILAQNRIDVLYQDVRFGADDARDFIGTVKKEYPDLKIVILTSLDDQKTIETLFDRGADGAILKSDNREQLVEGLEAVLRGEKFVSAVLKKQLVANLTGTKPIAPVRLTPREKEVLAGILAEKSTKEIAKDLFLSEKTIESYRANLFVKFDVKNVVGLVKKALLIND